MTNFKQRLGILYPIVAMCLIYLAVFTVSRIALSVWQIDRVNDVDGWMTILLSGLRIDLASVGYLLALPALLTCLLAADNRIGKKWLLFLRIWLVFGLWIIVYMEVATVPFILEYDARPNRLFLEYLIYPKEVLSMLLAGYKIELAIATAVSIFTLFYGWKLSKVLVTNLHFPRWYWRPALAILTIIVCVSAGRSTLGHRPLNPAMVAFSTDPLINDLTLNSSYSVTFALKQMKSEANAFAFYPKMEEHKIIQIIQTSTNTPIENFTLPQLPTVSNRPPSYQGKPKNLVILLQESLGARYVGGLGGLPLTPNIDKLMQESWSFTRMYATGTRSVRGIEAVITGFTPTPARAVVKLGKSQTNFFTIAELLKRNNYHTQFIYGGESHFDNMKSFFLGNGFMDMQDLPTFENPTFVGSWGASDEDLYNKADQQFTQLAKREQPFFSLVFTSSNHTPFEYPDGRIEAFNSPKQTRENAAKYSDYALGEFIKNAKKSSYWKDTIFVIVADHDSRAFGNQLVPIDHFRIPTVIFGEGISQRKDDRLVSQIDIAPTLLSMIGITNNSPMIGHDLTQTVAPSKQRAIMQNQKNFAWMNNNNEVVIFHPKKPPTSFIYDPLATTLSPSKVSAEVEEQAHAHALWGSLAYDKGYYRLAEE